MTPFGDMHLGQHWPRFAAPSHYLNQCWLLIIEVLWNSAGSNFTASAQAITCILDNEFETYTFFYSLAPGKFEWNFRYVIFKQILVIDGWGISCEIALIWMPLDLTYDQSTLVQVMAWCRQATSHYLSQCWPRSFSPYGVTRPQLVKLLNTISSLFHFTRCR